MTQFIINNSISRYDMVREVLVGYRTDHQYYTLNMGFIDKLDCFLAQVLGETKYILSVGSGSGILEKIISLLFPDVNIMCTDIDTRDYNKLYMDIELLDGAKAVEKFNKIHSNIAPKKKALFIFYPYCNIEHGPDSGLSELTVEEDWQQYVVVNFSGSKVFYLGESALWDGPEIGDSCTGTEGLHKQLNTLYNVIDTLKLPEYLGSNGTTPRPGFRRGEFLFYLEKKNRRKKNGKRVNRIKGFVNDLSKDILNGVTHIHSVGNKISHLENIIKVYFPSIILVHSDQYNNIFEQFTKFNFDYSNVLPEKVALLIHSSNFNNDDLTNFIGTRILYIGDEDDDKTNNQYFVMNKIQIPISTKFDDISSWLHWMQVVDD